MTWELCAVFAFVFALVVSACVYCWDSACISCEERSDVARTVWTTGTTTPLWTANDKGPSAGARAVQWPPPPCPNAQSATASSPAATR